ncbi:MAG: 50S ribosomal protein L20 [Planctomycetota bacterium]|nr:MAG: 50S ribosomal protein L20 [Planctomycetota bacterium]
MRVTSSVARHKRKKRIMKAAKGYRGGRSKLYRTAKESVARALQYSYRDRKKRRSQFRRLWIVRINAACRQEGTTYSQLISALKKANIQINRKMLSEMAVSDPESFRDLLRKAQLLPKSS